ncbi:hypothetical protein MAR_020821 [Mya arenaria]|uniref:Uncharacterized protein n=1 Tax=Mya arenaria TaxID=6604 RepID=A0ABY7E611_MYAAR|nr:hypothetical protein MAR_020821 [Mya arenaria]
MKCLDADLRAFQRKKIPQCQEDVSHTRSTQLEEDSAVSGGREPHTLHADEDSAVSGGRKQQTFNAVGIQSDEVTGRRLESFSEDEDSAVSGGRKQQTFNAVDHRKETTYAFVWIEFGTFSLNVYTIVPPPREEKPKDRNDPTRKVHQIGYAEQFQTYPSIIVNRWKT